MNIYSMEITGGQLNLSKDRQHTTENVIFPVIHCLPSFVGETYWISENQVI